MRGLLVHSSQSLRFGLKQIDYLKMDCEGAEYDILEHAPASVLQQSAGARWNTITSRIAAPRILRRSYRAQGFEVQLFGGHRLYARRLS